MQMVVVRAFGDVMIIRCLERASVKRASFVEFVALLISHTRPK